MKDIFKNWYEPLKYLISSARFKHIVNTLHSEYSFKQVIPSKTDLFKAFQLCEYDELKIVIIGKSPYPDLISLNPRVTRDVGLAYGNDFTTNTISPILKDIRTELKADKIDITLENWARQGVLLLNDSLSTVQGEPNSHVHIWTGFTKQVVKTISTEKQGILYVFFEKEIAKNYKPLIDEHQNWIFEIDSIVESNIFNNLNFNLMIQGQKEIEWI